MMHGRIFGLAAFLLIGCVETEAPVREETHVPDKTLAQSFDAKQTGGIEGQVIWEGPLPTVEKTLVRANAFNPNQYKNPPVVSTPHVPRVDAETGGIANAVVFLRQVDPRRSRPWHHGPPGVVFRGRDLLIEQDGAVSQVGFARRGSAVTIINETDEYHTLRARGDAFFALPLREPHKTHERELPEAGLVDLTCAAGYYWMHAQLFVAEHPYYARTDPQGRFKLEQVPTGDYELICWLPSWHVERAERDPETGTVARLRWAPPREQVQKVRVVVEQESKIRFKWEETRFEEPRTK
jgi:hypothetical protein